MGIAAFLKRKNIVPSLQRYGIDAMGAMAQGLFCTLLAGTILNTIGSQFHIGFLTAELVTFAGKGYTIGGAQVSEKHAGFIINKGGATAKDVLDLIAYIKKVIFDNYGCELECEVIHVN